MEDEKDLAGADTSVHQSNAGRFSAMFLPDWLYFVDELECPLDLRGSPAGSGLYGSLGHLIISITLWFSGPVNMLRPEAGHVS
jgi:hypothetical protein